ncbi:TPA: glycoside hydrolase family 32 protein [bacterium]|nr:glycoside hydrolase family 32 protein [bacterium]
MYTTKLANDYIKKNKYSVNNKYRFKYHAMPPIGWMNDPNGLIYFNNEYHLFYQYNPYNSISGPMHWGHFTSKDLVVFKDEDVVLAPEAIDETGCFSGGAIVDEVTKELVLFYTKHYEKYGVKFETQNIVKSKDGINFVKNDGNIISTSMIPEHADKYDFRDPNPYYKDGYYYVFIGSKNEYNQGQILVYRSIDLVNFEYHFTIGPNKYFGDMAECPDFFTIDGYDVILVSATNLKAESNRFLNVNSSLYLIGKMDFENKKYEIIKVEEIDGGHDFYAPQTLLDNKNRRIMIGWLNMWGKDYYTHKLGHKWSGALTIPRKLSIKDGHFMQYPIDEIKNYQTNKRGFTNGMLISKSSDLLFKLGNGNFNFKFSNPNNDDDYFIIGLDDGELYLDSSKSILWPQTRRNSLFKYNKEVELRILP